MTSTTFPHFVLRGGHREVGRQHRDLDAGQMDVAVGPPCQHEYVTYRVSR